jgi:hypothetical protein
LELGLCTLKRISTLLVHNAWHNSYKANINYNFAQSEAKEIDEEKNYYKLAPRKRGISTKLLEVAYNVYKYVSRARVLLQVVPRKRGLSKVYMKNSYKLLKPNHSFVYFLYIVHIVIPWEQLQ